MLTKICPKRIISNNTTVINADNLFNNKGDQISVVEKNLTTINGKGYILLDFGKEICGGVRILANRTKDCKIKVVFGESATEAMADDGYKNAISAHSVRDFIVDLPDYSSVILGETGFRFVRLELLEDKEIKIKSVYAESQSFYAPTVWEYNGNDQRLKEIYTVAKRTVDLCASGKYVWDGVKRDRLVWAGDLYSEMLALTSIYGRVKKVEDTLNFSRRSSPLPCWMNNLISYSAWWLITLADYVSETNRIALAKQNINYIVKLAEQVDKAIGEDGSITAYDKFIDLSLMHTPYEDCAIRALYLVACKKAEQLCTLCGKPFAVWQKIADKLNRKNIDCGEHKCVVALKLWAKGEISEQEKAVLISDKTTQSTFMIYFV